MYFREKNIFFLETFIGGFLLNDHLKMKISLMILDQIFIIGYKKIQIRK